MQFDIVRTIMDLLRRMGAVEAQQKAQEEALKDIKESVVKIDGTVKDLAVTIGTYHEDVQALQEKFVFVEKIETMACQMQFMVKFMKGAVSTLAGCAVLYLAVRAGDTGMLFKLISLFTGM